MERLRLLFTCNRISLSLLIGVVAFSGAQFVTLVGSAAPALIETYHPHAFNPKLEYPNYFLPKEYRDLPLDQIPPEVIEKYSSIVEKTLVSISERMTLNVVTKKGIENQRIFPYLRQMLESQGTVLEVMPSGGLVRGETSYLYDLLHKVRPNDPAEFLERIASETHDISVFDIKGFGSDFDVLYRNKKNLSPEKLKRAQEAIIYTLNGVESKLGLEQAANEEKRIYVTIGDVKEYEEQTRRSVNQGGALYDNLAIDLSEKKILDPNWARPEAGQVFRSMIAGEAEYLAYTNPELEEDAGKQTARGIRQLGEMPWIRFSPKSLKRLESEIDSLIAGKTSFTPKAQVQLEKTFFNIRYGGDHNRFHRGVEGSIEKKIQLLFAKKNVRLPYYSIGTPLELRTSQNIPNFPNHLLKSPAEIEALSRKKIYHGTSVENASYSSRGGFLMSSNSVPDRNFGTAIYGDGSYFSYDRATANGYQKGKPFVFEAQFLNNPKIRYLDLDDPRVLKDPWIQKQLEAAGGDHSKLVNHLIANFDLDAIHSTHLLVQNTNALNVENPVKNFLDAKMRGIEDLVRSRHFTLSDYFDYQQYRVYGVAASSKFDVQLIEKEAKTAVKNTLVQIRQGGEGSGKALDEIQRYLRSSTDWPKELWDFIPEAMKLDQQLGQSLAFSLRSQEKWPMYFWKKIPSLLNPRDPRTSKAALTALNEQKELPPEVWKKIELLLNHPDPEVIEESIKSFSSAKIWPNSVWKQIPSLLKHSNPEVRNAAKLGIQRLEKWPEIFWKQVPGLLQESSVVKIDFLPALGHQSSWPSEVWSRVPRLLLDPVHEVAVAASGTLKNKRTWNKKTWDFLKELIQDPIAERRVLAIETLSGKPNWPIEITEKIPELLQDDSRLVSKKMIQSLWQFDRNARLKLTPEIWHAIGNMLANGSGGFDLMMMMPPTHQWPPELWKEVANGIKTGARSSVLDLSLLLSHGKNWPPEIWDVVPTVFKSGNSNAIRAICQGVEIQKTIPSTFWGHIPELLEKAGMGTRISISEMLRNRVSDLPTTREYQKIKAKIVQDTNHEWSISAADFLSHSGTLPQESCVMSIEEMMRAIIGEPLQK